jgi:hypothetical protein
MILFIINGIVINLPKCMKIERGWKISVYLFRRVFIVERINFRDRIVGNVKKNHAVPFVDKLLLKKKKLYVLRDIQYGPLLFYSITEINPFHYENTTEQVNWYFSSAVVSSWKGLTFIIRVFFPRYIVEHIFKRFNMPNINIYLECISFLKLYTRESLQSALSYMSQWSVEINYGTNR